jgi:FMN reductase
MSKILIIGTSLDPDSRSQLLARVAAQITASLGHTAEYVDMRELELPMAGPADSWDDPRVKVLQRRLEQHHRIILAVPIYNFDVNAATKNWLELIGGKWLEDATVGFICAAGGRGSYMSVMGFANALQLDFRAWIVPRFVYVTGNEWNTDEPNADVLERIHGLVKAVVNGPKRGE